MTVEFTRANGLVHLLRLDCQGVSNKPSHPGRGLRLVSISSEPELEIEPTAAACVINPVYQEFAQHVLAKDLGDGLCLLLTGSSFQHHFSAVFSLYRDRLSPSSIVLDVDLADRCREPIQKLAATYSVDYTGGQPELLDARPGAVAWRGGMLGEGLLELRAQPQTRVERIEPRDLSASVQVEARIDPQTFTQRLHYQWRWTKRAGLTR
jgi:hypothetical protein